MKQKNRLNLIIIITGLLILITFNVAIAKKSNINTSKSSNFQTGVIDRIDVDEIVIDDKLYKYSKSIQFLSRQGAKIETRWFKKVDRIEFSINSQNQILILKKL